MPKCLFDRTTGKFVGGTSFDDLPHDTSTHVQVNLPDYPDPELHRWDGGTGVRDATVQELQVDAAEQKTTTAEKDIDSARALRAVVDVLYTLLPDPKPTKANVITAIKTRYKELL